MKIEWRKFLEKHATIDYWQRVFRHSRNREFTAIVRSYHRNSNLLFFENLGDDYNEKSFYDIYLDYPSKGFFALFCQTLDALRYGDRFGLTPVVTWSDKCLYKENGQVNGSNNPFEYYFERVSNFERKDIRSASRVLSYHPYQRSLDSKNPFTVVSKTIVENNYYDEYIDKNAAVFKKYIKFKKEVLEYINQSMKTINMGNKTLGIHVRATDFNNKYVNHAKVVTVQQYLDCAKKIWKTGNYDKVFIATDDANVINIFKGEFGDSLCFYSDVFRSTDNNAVHFSSNNRKNHKYKLGLEVIRDMYTLAVCEGLIGGLSNVCITAQILKKGMDHTYESLNIINNGFNTTGKTTYQDHFRKKN